MITRNRKLTVWPRRRRFCLGVLLCFGTLAAAAVPAPAQFDPQAREADQEAILARPITVPAESVDTLENVLIYLGKEAKGELLLDAAAFRLHGVPDVLKRRVRLPAQKDVPLRHALAQVLQPLRATAVAGKGYIEIVPLATVTSRR